jgi:hypothetical protein
MGDTVPVNSGHWTVFQGDRVGKCGTHRRHSALIQGGSPANRNSPFDQQAGKAFKGIGWRTTIIDLQII